MAPISTLDELPAVTPKRRLLRIGKTVARVFGYCRANAWPLFVAAWFPCFLTTLCLIVLAFVLFADPRQAPTWLLSRGFDPRTWLSAIVAAPFSGMVFAFVLDRMANAPEPGRVVVRRGIESVKHFAIPGMRLEFGQRILVAALLLAVVQLLCGFAVASEHGLLVAGLMATRDLPLSPEDVAPWASAIGVFNVFVGGIVLAWTYLFVGDFLWTGSFDPIGCWRALDGNHLRFVAIMFIVLATVAILKYGLILAAALVLIPADAAAPSFLNLMLMHFGLAWPFDLLHLVLSAATVGTILGAFRPQPAR
ncbi:MULTISPECIES: hypothetical protein [Mesorhizobium]|uniref:hypothetical protein n=1 Tax=Mesorhizobium TaxID=68287 RepID=UPI0003CEDFCA|nr:MULTISPECIES: hypothetical protein [Mesorhizobium]ESY62841.1 hypothetical protein X742_31445 [Mesorhizobium sp. LNHC232B00]WJI36005.1 hypothetical protein NL534_19015 [Mesorhizobium opportunistum]